MGNLRLQHGANDWTERTDWADFKLTLRDGIGGAATFGLEVGDDAPPGDEAPFLLTLPSGHKFHFYGPCAPVLPIYGSDGTSDTIKAIYECVDRLSRLDNLPLPTMEFFESTSGEVLSTLIQAMDSGLNTSGIAAGNAVASLNTSDFSKFSDILTSQLVGAGGYTLLIDPSTGVSVIGGYRNSLGPSGVSVDKDSPDYSPMSRDKIEPNNEIINYIKVKGNAAGGPDHTVSEAREIDALEASFKLKRKPYGLDGTELLSVQFEGGSITASQGDGLTNVIPLHYPVVVSVADISLLGSPASFCKFIGRSNQVLLACYAGAGVIGAVVNGSVHSVATPLFTGGAAPDTDHQYMYDWVASFTSGSLEIHITEHYLDNTAGITELGTVTGVDLANKVITLSVPTGNLPSTLRFFDSPDEPLAFLNVLSRSGNTITVEQIPVDEEGASIITNGLAVASGDSAVTTTTDVALSVPSPAASYGKPQLQDVGSVSARSWTANFGPAIDIALLDDPAYGVVGRKLRIATNSDAANADVVVQADGAGAIVTFVGDRLPTRGPLKFAINYDAIKQAEAISADVSSIGDCGMHAGATITSEFALTEADCQAIADAVIADRAHPFPRGTIVRQWSECPAFPLPGMSIALDLPVKFGLTQSSAPISEVSIDFTGANSYSFDGLGNPIFDTGIHYHMTIGEPSAQSLVERDLLMKSQALGLAFRNVRASGPRISGFTWNDTNLVSLSISGVVTIGGRAGSSFDPAEFASGNLRDTPVQVGGSVDGKHEVFVEIIYPPLPVDSASAFSNYNAKSNSVTFHWGRSGGAISFPVEKLVDDDNDPLTAPIREKIGEVFTPAFETPYEPLSKKIWVQTVGLADKIGGDPVEIVCSLPQIPAPTPFEVIKVKANDVIKLRIGGEPTGRQMKGRVKLIRIYQRRTDAGGPTPGVDPSNWKAFFPSDNNDVHIFNLPLADQSAIARYAVDFEDTENDDAVWLMPCFVDGFGDEGAYGTPFDATRPPMTVGSISTVDFWQSAPQSSGGAVEDDNETTPQVEFTAKLRYHLGHNNTGGKLFAEESLPMPTAASTPTWSGTFVKEDFDVTDADVVNGYTDIEVKRKLRYQKKGFRAYRPTKIVVRGVKVREQIGPGPDESTIQEVMILQGYTGTPPALVPHEIDGVFNMAPFVFVPGKGGLSNTYNTPGNTRITNPPEGIKYGWENLTDAGLDKYVVAISPMPFGTRGPGSDANIDADLDALAGEHTITLYNVANTTRNVLAYVFDAGVVNHHKFDVGDVVHSNDGVNPDLTITKNTTYYVAVIARSKPGRWSGSFSVVRNTTSGASISGDIGPPGPVTNLSWSWKDGVGYKLKFDYPTVNATAIQYYWAVVFDDVSGTTYMDPETGAAMPGGTTEAQARFQIAGSPSFPIKVGRAAMAAQFITNGVKIKLWAVNSVGGVLTEATNPDKVTSARITPGSDFVSDRAAANWINSSAQATAVQAGLSLLITKKVAWLNWNPATHLVSSPDDSTNVVKYGYKLQAGNGSNNWLDIKNPGTPITLDANSEFFTTALEVALGTMRADMAAVFQTNGLKLAVRAYSYVGGVLTAGPFTQYTSVQSVSGDPRVEDSAAPGIVQNLILTYSNRKGYLATWDRPLTNIESLLGYYIDYSGVTHWMNAETGQISSPDTQLGSRAFKTDNRHVTGLKKSQLDASFIAEGVTINVAAVNRVAGVETVGPRLGSARVFPLDPDLVSQDVVAPSSLTIPVIQVQPEVLRVQNMHADANNSEHLYTAVVFKVFDAPVVNLIGYINPATNGLSATEVRTNIGKSGHYNLRITVAQLLAAFGGPSNRSIVVQYYVTNKFGTSLISSASLSVPFSSLGTDLVSQDQGPPSSLATPNLIPKKEGVLAKGLRATANNNVMLYDELVIKVVDSFGSLVGWLDPNSVTGAAAAASEAAARLVVADGQAHFHKVRKDDLVAVWGATRFLRCYYYSTNEKGTNPTPSADSSFVAISSLGSDSVSDGAAPAAPPAPGVKEYFGDITVKGKFPSTGGNSITRWQMAMTDVNSTPTSADPPSATGGATVFDYVEGADSSTTWRVPGITGTRYFWSRCQNASNPGVWSFWSVSTSQTGTSRPKDDEIGTGVPTHANVAGDPLAPSGFADVACTIPSGTKVPVHIWDDGTDIFFELILPTDSNAVSLVAIDVEIYRTNTGALRLSDSLNPATKNVIQYPLHSWPPSIRFRVRNKFRVGGSSGYSVYTSFAVGPSTVTSTANYNPIANPPPDNDPFVNYPNKYPTL